MSSEERLIALITEQYKSIHHFCECAGIPDSTMRRILSPGGLQSTTLKNILTICSMLELSVASRDQELILTPFLSPELSEHEKLLIQKYRENKKMQPAIDQLLNLQNK